jgi:hypothetical protein
MQPTVMMAAPPVVMTLRTQVKDGLFQTGAMDCSGSAGGTRNVCCEVFWCPCVAFGKIAGSLPPGRC